jgi:hypothetical protein
MSTTAEVLSTALFLSFIMCCVMSGMLQVLAWSRHAREGAPVSFRALLNPDPFFDEVGVRQIRLARRLLTLGAGAYVVYVAAAIVGGGG